MDILEPSQEMVGSIRQQLSVANPRFPLGTRDDAVSSVTGR